MKIQLREFLSKGTSVPIRESLNADWLQQVRSDVISASPLEVDLTATATDGIAHVEGKLSVEVEFACSRCLEPVKEQITVPFHERFKPAKAKIENLENEEEIIAVEEDSVDLDPIVEETMLLSLPFIPLCDEDCKGLCHTCGTNLNVENCGCSKDVIDPRLAALQDFFKKE
ncbi:YceD family protein [Paenibacillus nasutitermitis]|uniref:DUF177 domain-containing protein n=1 Tax=Paenibacillus nasutitermitis TaxID=1652958 RepID=A0A917DT70_9BACL|nr:DUF177 domain-containing protein [Paenibacillus nasutitermitis]GGD68701.1 hypothetical protein GCM10010911_28100 [Paenibacillus nasutitermitis]